MNGTDERSKTRARYLVEAAAWRTYLTEQGLESTPELDAWLAADDRHRLAWERVQRGWDLVGRHAVAPEVIELRRNALDQVRAGTRTGNVRHALRWTAAAACMLVGLATIYVVIHASSPDVFVTAVGERRVVTLADGSQLQLDSSTEVQVDYSQHDRGLKLIKGQARFDVAHDVNRPFYVEAAARKVVATGTAFNIDLLGDELYVTLIEGKVVILPGSSEVRHAPVPFGPRGASGASARDGKISAAARSAASIELTAGQQLVDDGRGTPVIAQPSLKRITAWQEGRLVFENEPLSSVAARVSRYSSVPLKVVDDRTARLRISGVFKAGDVEDFITTLVHYLPVRAVRDDTAIYLSSAARSATHGQHQDVRIERRRDAA